MVLMYRHIKNLKNKSNFEEKHDLRKKKGEYGWEITLYIRALFLI